MPLKNFSLPSYAKINLNLRVLGKRADGFHELCTVFQTVSLSDQLNFSLHNEIKLNCNDEKIPVGDRNLIVKAAKILMEKFKVEKGAEISLEKNIPSPGGLGGGSSNAAAALIGLIRLWEIQVNFEELCEIGKTIGSDVPFFFYGGTALGTGRGTEIFPLEDFREKNLLIVTPNVDVSTAEAFRRLNAPDLTNKASKSILKICRNEAETLDLQQSNQVNDFEKLIFEIKPEIGRVKKKLIDSGSKSALMSGSGASVFALFENAEQLRNAFDALQNQSDWRVFRAETISRSSYRAALGLDKMFGG